MLLLVLVSGCATSKSGLRRFDFAADTFSYRNELVWVYHHDATGKTTVSRRQPPPSYKQRCFVVSRAAREFFDHARFDPAAPRADAQTYRRLVRAVIGRSARRASPEHRRIVIPGYADLRSFSRDWERTIKDESGGAWRSYLQCGNWRMIFPFSRGQQERLAQRLARELESGRPQVAHLVRFPQLTINHGMLVYASEKTATGFAYQAYDPNDNSGPVRLVFDGARRTFLLEPNEYFAGGAVNVYPVYHGWCY